VLFIIIFGPLSFAMRIYSTDGGAIDAGYCYTLCSVVSVGYGRDCCEHDSTASQFAAWTRVRQNRELVKIGSPYSITERRVPDLIPVLGSQPAGDVSHKPSGRLPLLSAGPAVTPSTLKCAATNFAAW